jgi:hypothetical protein
MTFGDPSCLPLFFRFFQNKGAVAGVFSVLGLAVVIICIALITNAIRRRRALQFDRDVAAAAALATSRPPVIDDDDYNDGYGFQGGAGGVNPYSYENRGGHNFSAKQPDYSMAEIMRPPSSLTAGQGAGAAGIGTVLSRNRSQRQMFNDGYSRNAAPYPAMYDVSNGSFPRSGNGFGSSDPSDGIMRTQTNTTDALPRTSESSQDLLGNYPPQEGYNNGLHSPTQENFTAPRFTSETHKGAFPALSADATGEGMSSDDAYGGYVESSDTRQSRHLSEVGELPNPYSAPPPRPSRARNPTPARQPTFSGIGSPSFQPQILNQADEARASILDQEDYMSQRGTLKVRNPFAGNGERVLNDP